MRNCYETARPNGYCTVHVFAAKEHTHNETDRRKLAEELVTTEKSYVKGLKAVVRGFIKRLHVHIELGKPILAKEEIIQVFITISDICDLAQRLYSDLKPLFYSQTLLSPKLPEILAVYTPFLRMYITYVNNYERALADLQNLRESRPNVEAFFSFCERCEGSMLADYMIMPVQRVPRYLMLLKGILDNTAPTEPMYTLLHKVVNDIGQVADQINESFRLKEARERVLEVQEHLLDCDITLVAPNRYHIKDGPLLKKFNKTSMRLNKFKRYWFFLFNDMLMYTTVPTAKGYMKVKYTLPLEDMDIASVDDRTKEMYGVQLSSESVKSFLVLCETQEEKEEWMRLLLEARDKLRAGKATLARAPVPLIGQRET